MTEKQKINDAAAILLAAVLSVSCANHELSGNDVGRAQNVIVFLGDGMGVSTVTAARIFDGQSRGQPGEENLLSFERFPNVALVKTYNTNQQVPDSAGTATAIHTGEKTRAGMISIGPESRRGICDETQANHLETIAEVAKIRGKAVGFVTTARVTDASPATLYAHSPERDWESTRYMTNEEVRMGCRDIAQQFVDFDVGGGFDIVLGGGFREFYGSGRNGIRRAPDDDLIADWLQRRPTRSFIDTNDKLATVSADQQVLGLFSKSDMTYVADRPDNSREPSLAEMTTAAIEHLSKREGGYYLFVEGGLIDKAHHKSRAGYALLETQAFSNAVSAALQIVDLNDTLIIVTADHSHTLTLGGYPTRGNAILGYEFGNDHHGESNQSPTLAADGRPFTTLGYMNGPGAVTSESRPVPQTGINAVTQALVPLATPKRYTKPSNSETHGGEDVALYAIGPGADRAAGVIEQNKIFDILIAAFGWQDMDSESKSNN